MTKGFFVFFTGLMTTLFGVGGVENSVTDAELITALVVAVVGLLIMWAGTLLLKHNDRPVDNPTLW